MKTISQYFVNENTKVSLKISPEDVYFVSINDENIFNHLDRNEAEEVYKYYKNY